MEGAHSSETLVPLYQITRYYIPEGCNTEKRVIAFNENVYKIKLARRLYPLPRLPGGIGRTARKADNLSAICEPIV
jgi:hypothetical protein